MQTNLTNTISSLMDISCVTCDVVDGVESNSKFPHFEGILCLDATLQVLYALPVFIGELRVIVGQQRWSLEGCQVRMYERCPPVLPAIEVKLHRLRSSIVGILNNLLKKLSRPSDFFPLFCTKLVVSLCHTLHSRSENGDARLAKINTGS